jgi:hypothetical protein
MHLYGRVVKLADTQDLESCDFGCAGSIPVSPTIQKYSELGVVGAMKACNE